MSFDKLNPTTIIGHMTNYIIIEVGNEKKISKKFKKS